MLSYELSPKISFTTDYTFTNELPETGNSFNRHEVLAGPRYEYADKSFIFAQGGVTATDYSNGTNVLNPAWKAGITHTVDTFVAAATAGTSYTDDPLGYFHIHNKLHSILDKEYKAGICDPASAPT